MVTDLTSSLSPLLVNQGVGLKVPTLHWHGLFSWQPAATLGWDPKVTFININPIVMAENPRVGSCEARTMNEDQIYLRNIFWSSEWAPQLMNALTSLSSSSSPSFPPPPPHSSFTYVLLLNILFCYKMYLNGKVTKSINPGNSLGHQRVHTFLKDHLMRCPVQEFTVYILRNIIFLISIYNCLNF